MSPSGDEKFRCKCSTFAISSPWGGTNEVLLNLADLRVLQMKSCKSSVGQNEVQVGAWSSVESPSAVQVALGDHLENKLSSSDAGSLQEASKSSKLSPGGVQKASKRLQNCTQKAPQSAKLSSRGPQEVPSCSQEAPKRLQVAPKRLQLALKRLQVGSQRRPKDSKLTPRGAQEDPS